MQLKLDDVGSVYAKKVPFGLIRQAKACMSG